MYIYIHLHVYIHVYIHTCVHIYIHVYIHTYICIYTHKVRAFPSAYIDIPTYIHTYTHTYGFHMVSYGFHMVFISFSGNIQQLFKFSKPQKWCFRLSGYDIVWILFSADWWIPLIGGLNVHCI